MGLLVVGGPFGRTYRVAVGTEVAETGSMPPGAYRLHLPDFDRAGGR